MEQRKLNLEQLAKQFIRSNICPKCLEQMKKDNPHEIYMEGGIIDEFEKLKCSI